jgi:DNA (cytosine-5)-methyltransferase 1
MTKEQMVDFLYNKGISSNYNEPMTKQQIERLSEEQLETIIKNIFITHNLVNIQQVKGSDLEISNTDKYDYVLTYSFPCQDLSLRTCW